MRVNININQVRTENGTKNAGVGIETYRCIKELRGERWELRGEWQNAACYMVVNPDMDLYQPQLEGLRFFGDKMETVTALQ